VLETLCQEIKHAVERANGTTTWLLKVNQMYTLLMERI